MRSIMKCPVASLDPGATVRDAAEELLRNDIGALLVTDGARTGLISERDLVSLVSASGDIASAQIGDVLTWDLVWATPDDSIAQIAALMLEANVRHIPVGDGRTAVGIVSMRDVFAVLLPLGGTGPKGPDVGHRQPDHGRGEDVAPPALS